MNNIHANERQPFAEQTGKEEKRYAGRTDAPHTPLELRSNGNAVDESLRAWVYERAGRQLGKFATQIERIVVRFGDENGPRGGIDRTCTVEVALSSLPKVVVTERGATEREAFDRASGRAERATRRSLERHGFSAKAKAVRHRQEQHEAAEETTSDQQDAAPSEAEQASAPKPPRKSTQGSHGELPDSPLRRRAREATQSPQSKAVRAQARAR